MEEEEEEEEEPQRSMNPHPERRTEDRRLTPADNDGFRQSLRELRDLRSQLHHAADYYEAAFLKAAQKKPVMENTKSYICEAIVTVVDHLGSISSNLDHRLRGGTTGISQTEQRLDCLQQRLLTSQQYALSLDLSTMRWNVNFPRHHRHYLSPLAQRLEKYSNDDLRNNAHDSKASEASCRKDQLGTELAAAVPVFEGTSVLSRPYNHSIRAQAEDDYVLRSGGEKKKLAHGSRFLSFLQISRRRR